MEVSKEWLEFLREQYPKGSRIKLWELKDPNVPLSIGSMGTLDHIDSTGQFHIDWDDGRSLALVIGEDRFSVLPPEPQILKLYMPLTATMYGEDEWGNQDEYGSELGGRDLVPYEGSIRDALRKNQLPQESRRGVMHWYDENDTVNDKVLSAVFNVEKRDGQLWGVAECLLAEPLTLQEQETLIEYISGQASDGWGEGFEQRPISAGEQEMYVSLWSCENWTIQTEAERFAPDAPNRLPDLCWSVHPVDGTMICLQKGESGYTVSDWNTDDPDHNRKLATYRNQKRGITPEQEEAMLTGSLFGWEVPGADPRQHSHQPEVADGGMQMQ